MSTQPIERPRLPVVRRRRPVRSRLIGIGLTCAAVFAAAFAIGHTRGSSDVRERLPPSLPAVASPVPAALGTAPPIALAVSARRLEQQRREAAAARARSQAPTTRAAGEPPASEASVREASQPSAPVQTVPARTPAPPARTAPTGGGSHRGEAKGGTSFDSSG